MAKLWSTGLEAWTDASREVRRRRGRRMGVEMGMGKREREERGKRGKRERKEDDGERVKEKKV